MQHVNQAEADSIAVRSGDGQAYRLDFTAECAGVPDGREIGLETPEGWACGRPGEHMLVDDRACAISAVAPIDDRTFARIARKSSRQYPKTLPERQPPGPDGRNKPAPEWRKPLLPD
ncbi:DUF6491 family protein [Stenotrophomonas tumulicola]|uniref:Uncharacterized protein n=1 Tax=Stenotrophomonas tumulicola TaxID=1685415 RepID=A0A7W3FNA3_9GAMM|nr:hypothetical protein [Stenotrophomonas tumulicola]